MVVDAIECDGFVLNVVCVSDGCAFVPLLTDGGGAEGREAASNALDRPGPTLVYHYHYQMTDGPHVKRA
jgi:hypothetical protein